MLDFQVTKICKTYMHMVMKCIRALGVSHNTRVSGLNECPVGWAR